MNKIIEIKFGSHLYGTSTPESDTDIKGIYIPTAREIVLHSYKETIQKSRSKEKNERNTKDDIDTEILSLDRFLELLMDGQTLALDMLFSPEFKRTAYLSDTSGYFLGSIYINREKLLTKNVNAFVGYARQQAAKYGIKGSRMDALKRANACLEDILDRGSNYTRLVDGWATLEIEKLVKECSELISLEKLPLVEIVMLKGPKGLMDAPHLRINGRAIPFHATVKYARDTVGKMLDGYGQRAHKAHLAGGIDWKALSHAVRVNSEALELLNTGNITFPCPNRELLVKIKTGQLSYEQVAEMIEQGLADLYTASEKSSLREEPDREWAADYISEVYTKIVKSS